MNFNMFIKDFAKNTNKNKYYGQYIPNKNFNINSNIILYAFI